MRKNRVEGKESLERIEEEKGLERGHVFETHNQSTNPTGVKRKRFKRFRITHNSSHRWGVFGEFDEGGEGTIARSLDGGGELNVWEKDAS